MTATALPLATPRPGPGSPHHPAPATPPSPAPRHLGSSSATAAAALLLAVLGWVVVWVSVELGDVVRSVPRSSSTSPAGDPRASTVLVVTSVVLGAVVTVLAWDVARRRAARPTSSESVVLAVAGVLLAGTATALLHGTRWGMDALYSDAGFRTEAVTRFADTPVLADYAYRGLPAYYPPLLPWLQGRAAHLLGVPGWSVVKPAQLLVCLVVPVASWLLWRRVVPGRRAAWVAAVVAVVTALPLKPDEWLVLTLVVPWWLEVCRGVRAPGRRPRGAVGHGLVLGLLLLTHTYFLAPLALATVLGMALDLARRRSPHPRVGPGLLTALVALLVAAPSWVGPAWLRFQGASSDSLQLRWSPVGFEAPPLPVPVDPRGALECAGVLWLLWAVGRPGVSSRWRDLAGGLLLALVATYAFQVGGQLLQPHVAVLPEKSSELVEALLVAAGVLAVASVVEQRRAWAAARPVVRAVALLVVAAVAAQVAVQSLDRGAGSQAEAAQHVRYPDGGFPAGGPVPPDPHWHPWGVRPGAPEVAGASVAEVGRAWQRQTGHLPGAGDVVVAARADLSATVPVHLFVSWKSIYSHPQGRFADRLGVLEAVARCSTPACAHDLLVGNAVERVDGLVLNRDERGSYVSVTVDTFPEGWAIRTVRFRDGIFSGPRFRSERLPGVEVVTLRQP